MRTLGWLAVLGAMAGAATESPVRLYPTVVEHKPIVLERKGQLAFVLPDYVSSVGPFSEGLAVFTRWVGPEAWSYRAGFIDERGKVVIAPRFLAALGFSEGVASVQFDKENGVPAHHGYIDKTGKELPQLTSAALAGFSEGLAPTSALSDPSLYGYMDKTGKVVIARQFRAPPYPFREGRAAVTSPASKKEGFIDREGAWVGEPIYVRVGDFSDGLAAVELNGKVGYVDTAGRLAIAPRFSNGWSCGNESGDLRGMTDFSEGLAAVRIQDHAVAGWGYIDKTGAVVIPPQFSCARPFHEGLAAVSVRGNALHDSFGYIDTKGNLVLPAHFTEARDFAGGLAWVGTGMSNDEAALFAMQHMTQSTGDEKASREMEQFLAANLLLQHYIDKTGKFVWSQPSHPPPPQRKAGRGDGGVERHGFESVAMLPGDQHFAFLFRTSISRGGGVDLILVPHEPRRTISDRLILGTYAVTGGKPSIRVRLDNPWKDDLARFSLATYEAAPNAALLFGSLELAGKPREARVWRLDLGSGALVAYPDLNNELVSQGRRLGNKHLSLQLAATDGTLLVGATKDGVAELLLRSPDGRYQLLDAIEDFRRTPGTELYYETAAKEWVVRDWKTQARRVISRVDPTFGRWVTVVRRDPLVESLGAPRASATPSIDAKRLGVTVTFFGADNTRSHKNLELDLSSLLQPSP